MKIPTGYMPATVRAPECCDRKGRTGATLQSVSVVRESGKPSIDLRLEAEMLDVKATDQCRNCGDEFGNHDYVPDSIDKYKCPHPHQESGYGRHKGGDPNKFFPDYECCSAEEIQAWKDACERWDNGDTSEDQRRPYGIGVYVIHYDQFFEPREHDDDLIPDEIEDFEFDADLDEE